MFHRRLWKVANENSGVEDRHKWQDQQTVLILFALNILIVVLLAQAVFEYFCIT